MTARDRVELDGGRIVGIEIERRWFEAAAAAIGRELAARGASHETRHETA